MTTRLLNQAVHQTKVEFTFRRLDQFPINGDEQRIKIKRNDLRPNRTHVLEARRGGVSQLAAENEKRLPVHDELRGSSLLTQVRERVLLHAVNGQRTHRGQSRPDDYSYHPSLESVYFHHRPARRINFGESDIKAFRTLRGLAEDSDTVPREWVNVGDEKLPAARPFLWKRGVARRGEFRVTPSAIRRRVAHRNATGATGSPRTST